MKEQCDTSINFKVCQLSWILAQINCKKKQIMQGNVNIQFLILNNYLKIQEMYV